MSLNEEIEKKEVETAVIGVAFLDAFLTVFEKENRKREGDAEYQAFFKEMDMFYRKMEKVLRRRYGSSIIMKGMTFAERRFKLFFRGI